MRALTLRLAPLALSLAAAGCDPGPVGDDDTAVADDDTSAPADDDSVPDFDPELAARLQEALDASRIEADAPAATLSVYVPGVGSWTGASGTADLAAGTPTDPHDRFRIGSITKTYVGAVLLQLVAEGSVDLDAILSDLLPEVPHSGLVTLRQVLQHTAGYPDYIYQGGMMSSMDEPRTPWELLDLVADDPLQFDPGTDYEYSNTHYVIGALAIEAVTGRGYDQEVRGRLLDPHGLPDTFVPSAEGLPDGMAHGYVGSGDTLADVTYDMDPSLAYGAGEMVADADDLVAWARALYGGQVLDVASLATMTSPAVLADGSTVGYGIACQIQWYDGALTYGHSGATYGYQSRLRWRPEEGGDAAVVAVLVDNFFAEADLVEDAAWAVILDR
ncbi:beta-lactamase family protein [Myxococcota bacterium]|nr:beta-lactamase family protein [Myxococcota bacterium]